jgi:ABC-2 type transport system ATP-binding protein
LNDEQSFDFAQLRTLPSISTVRHEANTFSLTADEPHIALPALLNHLQQQQRTLGGLSTRHATLEDVFVNLTGRHLRDDS